MPRYIAIILVFCSIPLLSCDVFQLKWDREVQGHMQSLLLEPDEVLKEVIETWNSDEKHTGGRRIDIEFLQTNIRSMTFDNKKGHCRIFMADGLDIDSRRNLAYQTAAIFGALYWRLPEQKRDKVFLMGNIEDIEEIVFAWKKGDDGPLIESDRSQNFI